MKRVVLVVDDEESMRYFLRKTLVREGYEVIEASDGPEAIREAQSSPPDVALLDVRMPGMDGVALMRSLHASQPHLPVILMTAYGSVDNALAAMKQGASDYVTKPFRVDAIRTAVAKALLSSSVEERPHTLRDLGRTGVLPTDALPIATTVGRVAVPSRDLVPFLRERVTERGLPFPVGTAAGDAGLREMSRLAEMVYVDELLRLTRGNVSRAAQVAGITRPNMHRKIVDLGLAAASYRGDNRSEGDEG